jgi:hypothetical protein
MKHGAIYSAHQHASLLVQLYNADQVRKYQFFTKTATFYVCQICGILPFVVSAIGEKNYAVANSNSLEPPFSATGAALMSFDSESLQDRLEC